jgi:hypothetical protein
MLGNESSDIHDKKWVGNDKSHGDEMASTYQKFFSAQKIDELKDMTKKRIEYRNILMKG